MNKLKATIVEITIDSDLALVELEAFGDSFTVILINDPEIFPLQTEKDIFLIFKETEVSLARDFSGKISIRNRMTGKIKRMTKGKILTKVIIDYQGNEICALITSKAAEEMALNVGVLVEALVKTNEISLWQSS